MSVVAWQGASSASAAEDAAVIEPQVHTFYVAHSERVGKQPAGRELCHGPRASTAEQKEGGRGHGYVRDARLASTFDNQ